MPLGLLLLIVEADDEGGSARELSSWEAWIFFMGAEMGYGALGREIDCFSVGVKEGVFAGLRAEAAAILFSLGAALSTALGVGSGAALGVALDATLVGATKGLLTGLSEILEFSGLKIGLALEIGLAFFLRGVVCSGAMACFFAGAGL